MVDVPDVERQRVVPRQRVAAVDLRPAGDPRDGPRAAGPGGRRSGGGTPPAAAAVRPGSSRRAPRARASGSSSRLVERRNAAEPREPCGVVLGSHCVGVGGAHRAELHQRERPAAAAAAGLPEQHRRAVGERTATATAAATRRRAARVRPTRRRRRTAASRLPAADDDAASPRRGATAADGARPRATFAGRVLDRAAAADEHGVDDLERA